MKRPNFWYCVLKITIFCSSSVRFHCSDVLFSTIRGSCNIFSFTCLVRPKFVFLQIQVSMVTTLWPAFNTIRVY